MTTTTTGAHDEERVAGFTEKALGRALRGAAVRRAWSRIAGCGVVASLVIGVAPAGAAGVRADFDGDGRADLAVGIPGETLGATNSGAVQVIYGGPSGLTDRDQFWQQDSTGVPDQAEPGDQWGRAVAAGDFNNDGRADLAVGAPFEDVVVDGTNQGSAGTVTVLYGSATGLTVAGVRTFDQGDGLEGADEGPIAGRARNGDLFGHSLAAGDFDDDGRDDLAVGVPGEDESASAVPPDGAIHVLHGARAGLVARGDYVLDVDGLERFDAGPFGMALAQGDVDGDGAADLAVGSPDANGGSQNALAKVGRVRLLLGSPSGLSFEDSQEVCQACPLQGGQVEGSPATNDRFGAALAIGDFDGDQRGDLAVGVPGEALPAGFGVGAGGAVQLLYGTPSGLGAGRDAIFQQGVGGVQGTPEAGDAFGAPLAAGDLSGDGLPDLAIGVPLEDVGPPSGANDDDGSFHVLLGSQSGLTAANDQFFWQGKSGLAGTAEADDHFGETLAIGRFNDGLINDLAVGAPLEDVGAVGDAGAVNVVYGAFGGVGLPGNQLWHQDVVGMRDLSEAGDRWGAALPGG